MADLSPSAQEVLDTVRFEVNSACHAPWIASAAIRELADQVVPEESEPNRTINEEPERDVVFIGAWHIWNTQRKIRAELLAIATELEGLGND